MKKKLKKMLLYYCTLCALYPSLYNNAQIPSSSSRSSSSCEASSSTCSIILNSNSIVDADEEAVVVDTSDLETTTSEGLCDYVRELFDLDRQIYNDYQVRAMRKLLIRKSHTQILKEELQKQIHLIENDFHPFYKSDSFQVI
jgi:hypothetical protein